MIMNNLHSENQKTNPVMQLRICLKHNIFKAILGLSLLFPAFTSQCQWTDEGTYLSTAQDEDAIRIGNTSQADGGIVLETRPGKGFRILGNTNTSNSGSILLDLENDGDLNLASLNLNHPGTTTQLYIKNKSAIGYTSTSAGTIDFIRWGGTSLASSSPDYNSFALPVVFGGITQPQSGQAILVTGGDNIALTGTNSYVDFFIGGPATTRDAFVGMNQTGSIFLESNTNNVFIDAEDEVRFNSNDITRMTLTKGGDFGIGTATPDFDLSVVGVTNLNEGGKGIAARVNGAEAIWYDQGYFSWGFGGDYNRFSDAVRIGGSADPGPFKLKVDGDVDITGELTAASDERLKENIIPIEGALQTVSQLAPKIYNFKVDEFEDLELAEGSKMGFIAQELMAVLPELVTEGGEVTSDDGDTFKSLSVNYMELIPLLTKAIQEQQNTISTQANDISFLKADMAQLKAEMKKESSTENSSNAK